jgi:isocitrate/isopropylmalate dehydrogenase
MATTYNILVLPGDGIGPEVMTEAVKVLKVFENEHRKFNLRQELIGGCSIDAHGKSVTEEVKKAALESDAVLFAAVGGPKWDHIRRGLDGPEGGLLQLRKAMDIYANLRPCSASSPSASIAKEFSPFRQEVIEGVDFVVVRENCGGAYFGKKIEEEDYGTPSFTSSILSRLTLLFQQWTNGAIANARSSASPVSLRRLLSATTLHGPSSPWTRPMCSPRRGCGGALLKRR